jgi:hypothetical protein
VTQSNSALLIGGNSGSGKTSLIATAAVHCYRKHKKSLRLYTCDGGGYGTQMEALVEAGIVQVWRLRSRVGSGAEGLIEETCQRAVQGWWPASVDAGGFSAQGAPLIAPVISEYVSQCPQGHELQRVAIQTLLKPSSCPVCKTIVPLQQAKISQTSVPAPHMASVGAVAFDGLTSMSDWVMMSLADRRGRNEIGGEKTALGSIRSGDIMIGGNNRADYGFAQTQAEKWLLASAAIPGLVLPPIWSCLESRADDGVTLPFYGPAIAGQAKIGKVPQWVGNYVGTTIITDEKGKKEWRLYLEEYRGEDGVPHPYKCRAEPKVLPPYLSDAGGEPFSGFNLGVLFDLLEQAKETSKKRLLAEFGEIKIEKAEQVGTAVPVPGTQPSVPLAPIGKPPVTPLRAPLPAPRPPSIPPVPVVKKS